MIPKVPFTKNCNQSSEEQRKEKVFWTAGELTRKISGGLKLLHNTES